MELPRLEPLWQKYRDRGLTIIAVESERDTERALEFIAEHERTYHFVEDVEGDETVVGDKLGISGFPTSYLVDRNGKIIFAHLGFEEGDEEMIEQEILQLL